MKLNLLSAALITAALLTTPAMAVESQGISQRITADANARIPTDAHSTYKNACCRNRVRDLTNRVDHDVWGHWGEYYGPMVPAR
jgi:hypothetical protein